MDVCQPCNTRLRLAPHCAPGADMSGAIFPWRKGNEFNLLIDGPAFFPRMIAAIDGAQQQVDLELYLVEAGACADAVVEALVQAAQRKIIVRCLFDDFGSQAFNEDLRNRDRKSTRLNSSHITISYA